MKWQDGLSLLLSSEENLSDDFVNTENCPAQIQFVILAPTICDSFCQVLCRNNRLQGEQMCPMELTDREKYSTAVTEPPGRKWLKYSEEENRL